MKNKIIQNAFIFLILVLILLPGCKKKSTPAAATPVTGLMIAGMIARVDFPSGSESSIFEIELLDMATQEHISGAMVTISGPGGVTILSETAGTPGEYRLDLWDEDLVVAGASYTISVASSAGNFSDTFGVPGNIVCAADYSTVTLPAVTPGYMCMDFGVVHTPDGAFANFGPGNISPVNVAATGILDHGAGNYDIDFTARRIKYGVFPGSYYLSMIDMSVTIMRDYVK
jgi:hypothetical protein